jgi:hypothetical protein
MQIVVAIKKVRNLCCVIVEREIKGREEDMKIME